MPTRNQVRKIFQKKYNLLDIYPVMKVKNVPLHVQHAAMQSALDYNKSNFEKNKDLSNHLDQIREKCTYEIHGLLGSKVQRIY